MIQPSKLLAQCPMCNGAYQDERIQLIGERGATRLFHCYCANCCHAMLAIVLEGSSWVSSVGLMTDLQAHEAQRFQTVEPLAIEHCLSLHRELEQGSADFCQRIAKPKKAPRH